jgi:hypothetical protein
MSHSPRSNAPGSQRCRTRWRLGLAITALLGGVVALAACCPGTFADEIYLIRAPDADLQKLIDTCRTGGKDACLPLCRRVSAVSPPFDHCELHPDSHGYVQVHVGYPVSQVCL